MQEFVPFQKLSRLYRNCTITEKLDGTNAQVVVTEEPGAPLLIGSRNRWLTASSDNFGFAKWCYENDDALRALGPGRHFGEWWGQGIQRGYGLKEKRFYLFNAGRWNADNLPNGIGVVPLLYQGRFNDEAVTGALNALSIAGSVAAPGFMNPEGVVVYHEASGVSFKVTLGGDGHKGDK